jgi:hypothetical protein
VLMARAALAPGVDTDVHLGCPHDPFAAPALCGWMPPEGREPPALDAEATCPACLERAVRVCARCGRTHRREWLS